jgi:hypothetical protein
MKARLSLAVPIESRIADYTKDSRIVNGMVETSPEGERWVIKRPGYTNTNWLLSTSPSNVPSIYNFNGIIAVVGLTVKWVQTNTGVVTNLGTLDNPQVGFDYNSLTTGLLLTATSGWVLTYTIATNTMTMVKLTNGANGFPILPANDQFVGGPITLDQTTYIMDIFGNIYGSNVGNLSTWNALNTIIANQEADFATALGKQSNYLVAFKKTSIEFLYDAGTSPGSPLAVNMGALLQIGCVNADTVCRVDSTTIWVGSSKSGGSSVYMFNGITPETISTRYIEKYLDLGSTLTAFSMKIAGHILYILNIRASSATNGLVSLVYDITERAWYHWTSEWNGNSFFLMADSTIGAYFAEAFGDTTENVYFIDYSGVVYRASQYAYTDDGNAISFRVVTPIHDSGITNRKFYTSVEVVGDKATSNTNLSIRHYDDDYTTPSTFRTVNLSDSRPILYQLGSARRRAWEVLHTDNVPLRIQALEFNFNLGEQAQSSD